MNLIPGEGAKHSRDNGILSAHRDSQLGQILLVKSLATNNSVISLVPLILKTLANKTFSLKPKGFIFTLLPLGNSLLSKLVASSSSFSFTSTQNSPIVKFLFWSPTKIVFELLIWRISAELTITGLKTIKQTISKIFNNFFKSGISKFLNYPKVNFLKWRIKKKISLHN